MSVIITPDMPRRYTKELCVKRSLLKKLAMSRKRKNKDRNPSDEKYLKLSVFVNIILYPFISL
jgi:hypothetical protein